MPTHPRASHVWQQKSAKGQRSGAGNTSDIKVCSWRRVSSALGNNGGAARARQENCCTIHRAADNGKGTDICQKAVRNPSPNHHTSRRTAAIKVSQEGRRSASTRGRCYVNGVGEQSREGIDMCQESSTSVAAVARWKRYAYAQGQAKACYRYRARPRLPSHHLR